MSSRALYLAAAGAIVLARPSLASTLVSQVPLPGSIVPKFVEPVPVFGAPAPGTAAGAPGAALPRVPATCPPSSTAGCSTRTGIDGKTIHTLDVRIQEFPQQILPPFVYPANVPGTWVWGYKVGSAPPHYPAVTIEAYRGAAAWITWLNELPAASRLQPLLTVDQTVHWADPNALGCMEYMNVPGAGGGPAYPGPCLAPYAGAVPTVTHLHGAELPGEFDGGPDQWFTADAGLRGSLYRSYANGPANGATFWYPNQQNATTLWFHDHALGTTRLNVYGGLAAFYLLRDDPTKPGAVDTGLPTAGGLPAGAYERELLVQDRQFDLDGQLLFPDGAPAGLNGAPTNPAIHPFWIPEFFGDVIVVNGKSWPYLEVEPRRYRFRIVNGSNARFYRMSLAGPAGRAPALWQIGTDGGLLQAPVAVKEVFLAPGERADLIADFTGVAAGSAWVLTNAAKAPFPSGAPPDPRTTAQIMQLRVTLPLAGRDVSCAPPACTLATPNRLVTASGTVAPKVKLDVRRMLVLKEVAGPGGPVEVLLNNTKWMGVKEATIFPTGASPPGSWQPVDGATFSIGPNYVTEAPRVGSTELWEIVNTTADAHPIHIHLVQFQLLNRQPYQANRYLTDWFALLAARGKKEGDGPPSDYRVTTDAAGEPIACPAGQPPLVGGNIDVTPYLQQSPAGPSPQEYGWKDTVVMYPGTVTRLVVRYAPQSVATGASAAGVNQYGTFHPALPFGAFARSGAVSPGYVWHCHILDHEDNEMMRPYAVLQ
jgi:FtsP/CotA-like multicopper oxidase with cupredoxin domain